MSRLLAFYGNLSYVTLLAFYAQSAQLLAYPPPMPVQRHILPVRPPDCRRRRRASTKLIMKTLKMRDGTVAQRRPLHKLLRRRCALAIASSASLVAAVVAAVQVVPLPVQCDGSDGLGAAFRSSLHARL